MTAADLVFLAKTVTYALGFVHCDSVFATSESRPGFTRILTNKRTTNKKSRVWGKPTSIVDLRPWNLGWVQVHQKPPCYKAFKRPYKTLYGLYKALYGLIRPHKAV